MSSGSPTTTSHAHGQQATNRQAERIVALLTAGTPLETVVTTGVREGWTRARVLAVIRERGIPLDASGRLTGGTPTLPSNPGALLDYAARLDDPRIAAQVAHVRADLAAIRAELAAIRDRQEAAARMVAADLRREKLRAQYDQTHRRRTDHTQEDTP